MAILQLNNESKRSKKTGIFWLLILVLLLLMISAFLAVPLLQSYHPQHTYAEKIFDQDRVTIVDIIMDEEDLTALLANPLAEEMYSATVVINGEQVEHVGVRTKGNSSLSSVARSDSERYSLKLDFDYYISNQHVYGLKKLNLNNNFSDSTQMREYVSYQLMEYMDVPTPAFSYMYVTVNGQEWGLYLGVENIEETFLQRQFIDGSGDLYKPEGTGSDLKWISDSIDDYSGLNLKTNFGRTDQSAMMAFLDVINHDGNIEQVADVDEMLRYFAANTALVNLDSYQGTMKHNYYLYEQDGIFSILPWDYNMSFGGFGGFGGGRGGFGAGGAGGFIEQPGLPQDGPAEEGRQPLGGFPEGGFPQGEIPEGGFRPGGFPEAGFPPMDLSPDANFPGDFNNPNREGGVFDMSANWFTDSNINFSITTPVSGTSIEDRPLLHALLSVDEYRERYKQYLEDIAIHFFTEEHIQGMMEQVSELILPYVEKDPTKFYTTQQFIEGIYGEQSLPQFAKQRAESILAQLSGELVVDAAIDDRMPTLPNGRGAGPDRNMNRDQGMRNEQRPPAQQFPNRDHGGPAAIAFPGMPGFTSPNGLNEEPQNTTNQLLLNSSFSILLVGAIVFVAVFQRRKIG